MKNLKILSCVTVFVTVVMAAVSLLNSLNNKNIVANNISLTSYEKDELIKSLNSIKEMSFNYSSDTIQNNDTIKEFSEITQLKNQINLQKKLENEKEKSSHESIFKYYNFFIKAIFSFLFCLAAFYIILSKKYDNETKKWAYSVLTLIAGVWIGTSLS